MTMFVVTSCGTSIGKTFITCALIEALRARGKSVAAQKPVISGMRDVALGDTDSGRLLAALGRPVNASAISKISPWQFDAPLTPSMAARLENTVLDMREIVSWCRAQNAPDRITLVEGAGGVMAPLTDTHTMRDFFHELDVPLILVVGCYLGSISHTLTALEALKNQRVLAVVVTDQHHDQGVGLQATCQELRRFIAADIPVLPVAYAPEKPHITALVNVVEDACS